MNLQSLYSKAIKREETIAKLEEISPSSDPATLLEPQSVESRSDINAWLQLERTQRFLAIVRSQREQALCSTYACLGNYHATEQLHAALSRMRTLDGILELATNKLPITKEHKHGEPGE